MNKKWTIALPLFLLVSLGCGLASGIQQLQSAATQLPGVLTSAPTMLGPMETAAAQYTPPSGSSSSGGTQGFSLTNAKLILQMTQQFEFKDGTVDGKQASIATLSASGKAALPAMGSAFSAAFIGDPQNLDSIKITAPRDSSQDSVDQAIGLDNVILTGLLPTDVSVSFATWLTENYAGVAVGGKMDKTIGSMQFTLERTSDTETLTVTPTR
jgi:hypothetical protein